MSGPGVLEHVGRRVLGAAFGYRSEWVPTSVGRIHVLSRAGSGELPPVYLFHGFGSAAIHLVPLVRALRPHVRHVTTFDLPAHGFSDRPAELSTEILRTGALEALDRIHTEPAVVVGNSLGGVTAMRYLHARSERVLGAVLLAPAGAPMTAEELESLRSLFRVRTRAQARAFLDRLYARPPGWRGHVLAGTVVRTFTDPTLAGWLEGLTPDGFLTPEEVSGAPRPVRVVWGKDEKILPREQLAFWRRHLPPDGEIVEPEGFGHSPHFDAPEAAAREVLALARAVRRPGVTGAGGP